MILENFLENSSKKVTTVGESGEIPHFCYLGSVIYYVSESYLTHCMQGLVMPIYFIVYIKKAWTAVSERNVLFSLYSQTKTCIKCCTRKTAISPGTTRKLSMPIKDTIL